MKLKYLTKLFLVIIFCSFGNTAMAHKYGHDKKKQAPIQIASVSQSQTNSPPEIEIEAVAEKPAIPTTNILHQNKRINLVVFVLAIIFVGIILYLTRIERQLYKLEQNNN